jgi:hypothetical protein
VTVLLFHISKVSRILKKLIPSPSLVGLSYSEKQWRYRSRLRINMFSDGKFGFTYITFECNRSKIVNQRKSYRHVSLVHINCLFVSVFFKKWWGWMGFSRRLCSLNGVFRWFESNVPYSAGGQ